MVGQDADLDACQRIVEGTQCMTVYKPVEKLARRAAELAVALAEGSRIATAGAAGSEPASSGNSGTDPQEIKVQGSIHDGTWQVPYECLEPVAVTRENMDEVITGKYHEESDIYLNVRN